MKKVIFYLLLPLILISCNSDKINKKDPKEVLQDGDIIFQGSESAQSKAIQLATHSKYSHCGIIFKTADECYVFEAVQPVQSTPLKEWIKRGKDGKYVVKRLKDADKVLTAKALAHMKRSGGRFTDKDYDFYFDWSNQRIYCSELVWKIYKRGTGLEIGHLQKLKDFDLSNPIVKEKLAERYGDKIPYNETVISPGAMFDSELLMTVISN
jgi:uncharacterized protein YycO